MYFRCPLYRKAVTAYSTNMNVFVNSYNLNDGLYPAINFRPAADRPYYTYVPIASFANVGAIVKYDETKNEINVTTDYFDLKKQKDKLKEQSAYCKDTNTTVELDDIVESFNYPDSTIIQIGEVNFLGGNNMSIIPMNRSMYIENLTSYFSNKEKVKYFRSNHQYVPSPGYDPNVQLPQDYSCSMDPDGCSFKYPYMHTADVHIKTKNNIWIKTSIQYFY